MSKSALVVLAVAALIAGCVSVTAPSSAPTSIPSAAVPTLTASPGATSTAVPSPTSGPSDAPTPAPTPQPTTDPGFDQRDVLFNDDLGNPASGWGVGDIVDPSGTHVGLVGYVDGALQIALDHDGGWAWSRRLVDSSNATLRVAGEFIPASAGRFGVLCAADDEELYGALVGTDGSWALVKVTSDGAEVLIGDSGAGLSVPIGSSTLVAVECSGMATGSLRLSLWVGPSGPVGIYELPSGPDNFDRAATYAEAASDGFSVSVNAVVAFGSGVADGQLRPDAEQLLTHVPTDMQSMCYEGPRPPFLGGTAEALLTCFLPALDGSGPEIADFAAFLTTDAMNRAYQNRIDAFGTGDGVISCADGSGEHTYDIGGTQAGRLLCVAQFSGIRFDWTDTRLNILSSLVDLDGNYGETFDAWNVGGPNL